MTMSEWWCESEHHSEQQGGGNYAGNLTQGDVEEMQDDLELSDEDWWKKHGAT